LTRHERERLKESERENRERNRANEILRRVSAFLTRSGTRPPAEAMMPFIDSRRAA
jgi:transposase-like protein